MEKHGLIFSIAYLSFILSLSGCIGSENDQEPDFYASFTVVGGAVASDRHVKEHVIDNGFRKYRRLSSEGNVSFEREDKIGEQEVNQIAKNIQESGLFAMLDEYRFSKGVQYQNRPNAEIEVRINGQEKKITIEPYVEELTPGNLKRVIFEIKSATQHLQG